MILPFRVKIYKDGKYLGIGKWIKEKHNDYILNFLTNLLVFSGHYEDEEKTGYKYGDRWSNETFLLKSNKEFIDVLNKQGYGHCYFELCDKKFKEIVL